MRRAPILPLTLALSAPWGVGCADKGGDPAADTAPVTPADSAADDTAAEDTGPEDSAADDTGAGADADGDGSPAGEDCDDGDAGIYPGNDELCDGSDQDCDDAVDEDAADAQTWYPDADGDGYGEDGAGVEGCEPPDDSYVDQAGDCDDAEPAAWSGAEEICRDGIDNDCDGTANDCGLSGPLSGAKLRVEGVSGGDYAGWSLAGQGDLDGDGAADAVFGAPTRSATFREEGAAYVIFGGAGLPSGTISLASADRIYTGEADEVRIGAAAAILDLDGDGADDLALGATGTDFAGAIYLLPGPVGASGLAADAASTIWLGRDRDAEDGVVLSPAGDVDGDGIDDLLAGGAASDGSAWLLPGGSAGGWLDDAAVELMPEDDDYAGAAVGAGGDVDGDGLGDLLVGAYGEGAGGANAGAAYLITAAPAGPTWLADAEAKLIGEASYANAGAAVAIAADTDGDGYDDLVVGAPSASGGAGAAYVVPGPISGEISLGAAGVRLDGEGSLHYAGRSVSGAGDLDGDGYGDVLVGAPGESSGGSYAGAAYVIYGPVTAGAVLGDADKLTGGAMFGYAGWPLVGAEDLDGDGARDLLVGGWAENAAWIVSGSGL